jgi:hypothetical protein
MEVRYNGPGGENTVSLPKKNDYGNLPLLLTLPNLTPYVTTLTAALARICASFDDPVQKQKRKKEAAI